MKALELSEVAILLSALALVISAVSLGWNIYRDIALKPRVRVTAKKSILVNAGEFNGPCIIISAVNHGPGNVIVTMIWFRRWSWLVKFAEATRLWWLLKPFGKSRKQGVITHEFGHPFTAELPKKLEPGDNANLVLSWPKADWLLDDLTHLGLADSFGREHWVPVKDIKDMAMKWRQEFPQGRVD